MAAVSMVSDAQALDTRLHLPLSELLDSLGSEAVNHEVVLVDIRRQRPGVRVMELA